ncbi:uncharacterized protein [Ptychodera flava]|uniref:uncharacterized protein n=1 Tax=Ptychodera flava TaxID=63121 RepID=UPI003969E483
MAKLLYSAAVLYTFINSMVIVTDSWPNTCYYNRNCYGYCCSSFNRYCCSGCNGNVENCADTRCTTSSNRYCYKCAYDRGGGKMAYEPVDDGPYRDRVCEQRCSWRQDSKFCYPGTCHGLPSTCACLNGFGGDNCLTVNTKPKIESCHGVIQRSGSGATCIFDCSDDGTVYCGVNSDRFVVDWVASYDPSLSSINRPYYVNDTGYGIVSAVLNWQLMRDNNEADGGVGVCLSEESHILNIPKSELPRRSCSHTIGMTSTVRHNDRLSLTLRTKNSGYIKINNYDQEDVVTVDDAKFYSGQITEKTTDILFDFAAPQHCIVTSSECTAGILGIINPYTRNSDVTVTWEPTDWNDVPSGIHHYDCEAYRLTSDPSGSGLLGMRTGAPHASERNIDRTVKSVQLNLPDTGVFAIIVTVTDTVGNSAKVRRFLTYDPDSVIRVDKDKPITASEGAFNAGLVWLTRSKGDITATWAGHFFNAFYRDGKFLNGIEEHDPPLGPYDESTGMPPSSRSRQAIPNDSGIVRFQFDFAESSSGRDDPENWVDIDEGKTTHTISITDDNNEFITIWMKAFDVMDNMKEERKDKALRRQNES